MMRAALSLLLAALVAACAAPTVPLASHPASATSVFEAIGTLSTNACEAQTAADYTAVIVARRTATQRLQRGTLSVEQAKAVQASADAARAALDAACHGRSHSPDPAALRAARAAQAQLTTLMEPKQ